MGESEEGRAFVLRGKERVLRCAFQVASRMRPYTPSPEQGSDEFLKYVVEMEIMKKRGIAKRTTGKKQKCVDEMPRDLGLKRRMKQTLSDLVRVRRRMARDKLFALLRTTRLQDGGGPRTLLSVETT